MRHFLALVLALGVFLSQTSFAMPVPANAEFRLNHGPSSGGPGVQLGYQVISNKVQLMKCKYDVSVQGGSSAAAITLLNVDGSQCTLPSKAIVLHALIDVITTPIGASSTIAVGTGQAANDIKTATATASYTGILAGVPVGDAAHAIKMTAERKPTMTIAVAPLTVGKFNVFIQYLLSN